MGAYPYGFFVEEPDLKRARAASGEHGYGGVAQVTRQVCHVREAERLANELLDDEYVDLDDPAQAAAAEDRTQALLDALGGTDQLGTDGRRRPAYGSPTRAADFLPRFMREKDGTVAAIPVGFDEELPLQRHGVPVDLVGLGLTETWAHQQPVQRAIRSALDSPRVATVEVLTDEPSWRAVTSRTEGAEVTRYVVHEVGARGQLTPLLRLPSYDTLEEAERAADEYCRTTAPDPFGPRPAPLTLEVVGRTCRADGQSLVRAERILASRFVVYDVGIVTPEIPAPNIRGWWLFGTAGM